MVLPYNLNRFGKPYKRPYYCEVEYLESDGNQYINTGIKLGSEFDVEINCTIQPTGQSVFGQRDGNVRNGILYNANVGLFFNIAGHTVSTSPFPLGQLSGRHKIRIKIDNYKGTTWVDGVKVQDNVSFTGSYVATTPLALFASNNNGTIQEYASSKVYSFKVTKGGVVVLDMLPVKDYNDVPCMYDKISKKLFYNQGTGIFTAGREIHYVEYLESTGTQYIQTDVNFKVTDEAYFKGALLDTGTDKYCLVPTTWNNNSNRFAIFGKYATDFGVGFGGLTTGNTAFTPTIPADSDVHIVTYKNKVFTMEDTGSVYDGTNTTWGGDTDNLRLFYGYNLPSKSKIYRYSQKRGGEYICDFNPAIDENGVGFMFDKVYHKIYDNAGTGTFKHSDLEVACIDNTHLASVGTTAYIQTGVTYSTSNAYRIDQDIEVAHLGDIRFSGWNAGGAIGVNKSTGNYRDGNSDLQPLVADGTRVKATIRINASSSTQTYYTLAYGTSISTGSRGHGSLANYATLGYPLMVSTNNFGGYTYYVYGRFWGGKIYSGSSLDNLTLVRNFKPIVRNGKAGLLDTVNNVFYSSIGSAEFRFRAK